MQYHTSQYWVVHLWDQSKKRDEVRFAATVRSVRFVVPTPLRSSQCEPIVVFHETPDAGAVFDTELITATWLAASQKPSGTR
jgi:hypothetical protein